jgi:hypothetical protein
MWRRLCHRITDPVGVPCIMNGLFIGILWWKPCLSRPANRVFIHVHSMSILQYNY